jgi:hypothetical protein
MRDEQLRELLNRADAGADVWRLSPHVLSRRVRQLHGRRVRRVRIVGMVSVLLVLLAAATGWRIGWVGKIAPEERDRADAVLLADGPQRLAPAVSVSDGAGQPAAVGSSAEALDEISRLAAEAEFHFRIARRMIADREAQQAAERRRRELALPDPLQEIREGLDRVAFRMIYEADRLREAMQPAEESIAIYRDVIRLFPTTHSAQLARERLSALGQGGGDS